MGYRVAVVGATGKVGREMLDLLAERRFPADEVIPLASSRSEGEPIDFDGRILEVKDLATFDFKGMDIAFSSPGAKVSKEYAPKAGAAGCLVIDNTSQFRMDEDVPLIVPEVNSDILSGYMARNGRRNIISNPNCSTIQLVVALKPLHDAAAIKRVSVATYQSVSGAGKAGMDELFEQTRNIYAGSGPEKQNFTKQIAFNLIPHIDVFMDDGSTREEWKMVQEIKKIVDPAIETIATCVRVPVFIGHSEAVHLEFHRPIDVERARDVLSKAPGISVIDYRADEGYVTPVECAGEDKVYVSRIRQDPTVPHGLAMWVVSDNLRKGAALNTIQIAETIIEQGTLKAAAQS
ncbi:MAG: aspartate-semialdehyde dehydrogenase [Rhodospirillaceae bacterium]|nr:aspartate-semialdehyde dehydrogenase [Rhodospirillaceae bacterium]